MKLLAENREAMDRIAMYLFKKENISGKQFMALFENRDPEGEEKENQGEKMEQETEMDMKIENKEE